MPRQGAGAWPGVVWTGKSLLVIGFVMIAVALLLGCFGNLPREEQNTLLLLAANPVFVGALCMLLSSMWGFPRRIREIEKRYTRHRSALRNVEVVERETWTKVKTRAWEVHAETEITGPAGEKKMVPVFFSPTSFGSETEARNALGERLDTLEQGEIAFDSSGSECGEAFLLPMDQRAARAIRLTTVAILVTCVAVLLISIRPSFQRELKRAVTVLTQPLFERLDR